MPSVVQLCGSLTWLSYVFVGSNSGSTPSECFLSWYLPLMSKRSRNRCCTLRERSKRLLCSRSLQPDSFGEGNRIGYRPSGIISETSHINSVWDVSERLRKRLLFRSLYPLVYSTKATLEVCCVVIYRKLVADGWDGFRPTPKCFEICWLTGFLALACNHIWRFIVIRIVSILVSWSSMNGKDIRWKIAKNWFSL
jgi:hypothetical protein